MVENIENRQCKHLDVVDIDKKGNTKGCEECEQIGSDWVHLRLCLTCGHVGCCDNSKNKHGTEHRTSNYKIIRTRRVMEMVLCG